MPAPVMQKDVEGPFWIVKGKRIAGDSVRPVLLVVRAHNAVEAKEKGGALADLKGWVGFNPTSTELY